MTDPYPMWKYYPPRQRPPEWVQDVVAVFGAVRDDIDSKAVSGTKSDMALAALRAGLLGLGFEVEAGKKKLEKSGGPCSSVNRGQRTSRTRSMRFIRKRGSPSR
jgi:hypothetical protein